MDYICAECGRSDKSTYVVTVLGDTDEDRTEVCLDCHYSLAEYEIHAECINFSENIRQVEEAERDTRENIIYELKFSLDSLVRAVEFGRPDDVVSPMDLLLHGESIAVARAAFEIALEAAGEVEAWRR